MGMPDRFEVRVAHKKLAITIAYLFIDRARPDEDTRSLLVAASLKPGGFICFKRH